MLASWVAAALAVAAAAAFIEARFIEPERLRVSRVEIPLAGLDRAFDGFRIVQVSDVHGKVTVGRTALSEAVAAQMPDAIVVTGDLIDAGGPFEPAFAMLSRLRAPAGVFFVPGNNESKAVRVGRTEGLLPKILGAGAVPLINRAVRVERAGDWFWLVGVDDPTRGRRDNLPWAMRGTDDGRPRVLLAHAPHILRRLGGHRVDYLITGHTHGGQVCVPWYGPLLTRSSFGRKVASGPAFVDGVRAYVSRGIGTSLLPLRFLCPPELVVHVLRRAG
ncbi:MAG: metallophosphoesterase [Bacillota bacterium]